MTQGRRGRSCASPLNMKRTFLGLALLISWMAAGPTLAAARTAARPNIVFLLADDLRWNALGCMGDKVVQTPNIDRLAAQGALFRNHFVTTSICCVSRASIFCGQYERRHGIWDFATPFTEKQWRQTYPALLRQAGYRTGFIGKFGVGKDAYIKAMEKEFDYWRGLPGQGGLFFDKNDPTGQHKTARFGDQALEFLRGSEPGKPFCLALSFTAPHARDKQPREFWPDPREEPLFTNDSVAVPKTATEEFFRRLPKSVQESESRVRWKLRFDTEEKFQRITKDYYRLIAGIDREVGRVVEELGRLGLGTNTVVVFTSDNGFFFGERGLADKWYMYEESIRVPLIVVDPRLGPAARGRAVDAMTLNIDFAPTFLDWAGLRPPRAMQGRSLQPLTRGEQPKDWRAEFFYEHHFGPKIIPPSEGVRTERWSYLRWINENPVVEELYDVQADPLEEHDLASSPASAKTLNELRARWTKLQKQLR